MTKKTIIVDIVCRINLKTNTMNLSDADTLELSQILASLNIEYAVHDATSERAMHTQCPDLALTGEYDNLFTFLTRDYGLDEESVKEILQ